MSGGLSVQWYFELSLGSISHMASVKRAAINSNELVLIWSQLVALYVLWHKSDLYCRTVTPCFMHPKTSRAPSFLLPSSQLSEESYIVREKKTKHANIPNTSKLRKHICQFDNTNWENKSRCCKFHRQEQWFPGDDKKWQNPGNFPPQKTIPV